MTGGRSFCVGGQGGPVQLTGNVAIVAAERVILSLYGSCTSFLELMGGVEMAGSPLALGVGRSTRLRFAGVKNGPVIIVSDEPIVAAQRVIHSVKRVRTSYSGMMDTPNIQLATAYWLPL